MRIARWIGVVVLLTMPFAAQASSWKRPFQLDRVNGHLHGTVVNHTHNHRGDYRIWSDALQEKRDVYVYLPPGYDGKKQYPLMIYLHGVAQDEHSFIKYVVEPIDQAIACGKLPPMVVAAPDGSLHGWDCMFAAGSFFVNSKAGNFEDYLLVDVWNFLLANYSIRPERQAHVLAGVSMGGGAAFNLGIKYRDRFGVIAGIFPPLNMRWVDCHCRYMANFDPCCWGWRTDYSHPWEVIGRFYGVVTIRMKDFIHPLYDRKDPDIVAKVASGNPIEVMEFTNLKPGELEMYVCYGGKDQFNMDAQIESFLYTAKQRGVAVTVDYLPRGKHDAATAMKFLPGIIDWVAVRIAPYSPQP